MDGVVIPELTASEHVAIAGDRCVKEVVASALADHAVECPADALRGAAEVAGAIVITVDGEFHTKSVATVTVPANLQDPRFVGASRDTDIGKVGAELCNTNVVEVAAQYCKVDDIRIPGLTDTQFVVAAGNGQGANGVVRTLLGHAELVVVTGNIQCQGVIAFWPVPAVIVCKTLLEFACVRTAESSKSTQWSAPLNSSHLLSTANAQRDATARDAVSSSTTGTGTTSPTGTTNADLFVRQLEGRLLSALAGQVTEAIFGSNPSDQGTVTFGTTEVTFERTVDSISLTIVDSLDGTVTEIVVPQLVTGS